MTTAANKRVRIVLWTLAGIAVVTLALGLRVFWIEPASLTILEQRISVPSWSGGPLRIAILTDLHVGSAFIDLNKLREVVARTNATEPDIICFLGDLLNNGPNGHGADEPGFITPERAAPELSRLRAHAGVYGVLGNHDSWLDHDRVARAVAQSGVRLLEDTAAKIDTPAGPIWVAGVSDRWTGKHDVAAALAAVDGDGTPVILMTHNPDIFPEVPDRVSLTLAGHTHGGQVRLPFVGTPIVPSQFGKRFAAGHVVEGGRHLFVSTGIGTSILPVRFRVPPAVVLLTVEGTRAH